LMTSFVPIRMLLILLITRLPLVRFSPCDWAINWKLRFWTRFVVAALADRDAPARPSAIRANVIHCFILAFHIRCFFPGFPNCASTPGFDHSSDPANELEQLRVHL